MKARKPPWRLTAAGFQNSRLRDSHRTLSWDDFDEQTARLAGAIAAAFPARGTPVGLWGVNSLDYVLTLFSVIRAGSIAVPFNTRLTPEETARLARFTGIKGLLASPDLPSAHAEALPGIPIFAMSDPDLKAAPLPAFTASPAVSEADTVLLVCSSGTDGAPKAVPFSMPQLIDHASAVCTHLSMTAADHFLVCLPLFHIGGLAIPFRSIVAGSSFTVTGSADPAELNRLIDEHGITLVSVVPVMLKRMLDVRGEKKWPESLRGIIVGGGPVPPDLIERCPKALPTYGLTEAGSMISCAVPGGSEAERRTAGSLLPQTKVEIVDENGEELPHERVGEIVVRGPGVAGGYWKAKNLSARSFREGKLHTGDVGFLDANGFLNVLARRTDLILSGGENIYPAEIEAALLEHPQVEQAAVAAAPDPEWGQVPAALIVLKPGSGVGKRELREFLAARLAGYKLPKIIRLTQALPLLASGKPDRQRIRRLFEEASGQE